LIKSKIDMAKTTLKTVAKAAGVGSATVERVLNGRGGVKPDLVERVLAAARKLDYPKRLPEQHRGVTRIEIVMARPDISFVARLSKSFERLAASLDRSIVVHRTFLDEADPAAIAAHIMSPNIRRSALIVALPQNPLIAAAIAAVETTGMVVVQVMTRLATLSSPYIGIDNVAAGRMAGFLLAGMVRGQGSVIALCHSQFYSVHRDRISGFSEYLQKPQASHLAFKQITFTNDDAQEVANTVSNHMRNMPDLIGIYGAGGDYGPLCDFLLRSGHKSKFFIIGHELNDQSEKALKNGTMAAVIDQAPETQARRALDLVLQKLGLLNTAVDLSPIRFITITAENI
jgi:LacI family transcriptional regulator